MRTKKVCRSCGKPVLMKDVAETRTVYPSNVVTYLCTPCKMRDVQQAIDEERKRLGLPPRTSS